MNRKTGALALGFSLLQAGAVAALVLTAGAGAGLAQDAAPKAHFDADIAPIFAKNCVGCHSGAQPKGDILLRFKDESEARAQVANDEFWDKVAAEVESGRMPPAGARNKPSDGERKLLVDWIKKDVLTIGGQPDPGPVIVHRLNNREYANTIRELLYLPADYNAAADFPADERGDGFDNNSDTLIISPLLVERYLEAAEKSVTRAFAPRTGTVRDTNVSNGPNPLTAASRDVKGDFGNWQALVRLNIEVFLPRAWRRPVTRQEIDEVMKFAAISFANDGESQNKAAGLAMRAALMSPNFLFRLEQNPDPKSTAPVFALTEQQLASRLSYFLWSTMPDEALMAEANKGTLRQNLAAQVARMLKDPKAASLTKDFMGQWLEIRGLENTPNVDKALLASMRGETEHFFDYIVANDRPITDMLFADYSFVDEKLAKLYGIPGVTGNAFQKVQLDPARRGGIITQASFLTLTSKPLEDGLRTSPVVRGKFILENLFNQKIPPPPPDVPPLKLDTNKQLVGTVRQIFEQHRENPVCAGCHARMDPYGFALENYSGTGEWRDKDNNIAVDASGEINGKKFTTPAEFRKVLETRKGDFRRAVVRKVLSYALGRGIQGYDRPAIEEIVAQLEKDGDKFSSVILNVARSYPFQNARNRGTLAKAEQAEPKSEASRARLQPVSLQNK